MSGHDEGDPGTGRREADDRAFTVRELTKHDEPRVLELLGETLSGGPTGERTSDFFRWKHRDNPFGASPGLVAELDGRLVAVRLFLRWEFVLAGEAVRAVRAVDTATHPDVQGRGLFRRLTTDLLGRIEVDTSFVFNTPNDNSLPGYLRMGWNEVGRVPIALHPIRPLAFARGLKELRSSGDVSGTSRVWEDTEDPSARCRFPTARQFFSDPAAAVGFDELVAEADAGDAAIGHDRLRTALTGDFLRWRYGDAPGLDYRVVASYKDGALTGVVFGRPRLRGPLVEFTLSQMVVRPGDRDTARKLFSGVAMSRCDHVATHLARGSEAARAARYAGYATPPRTGMLLVARTVRPHPIDLHDLRSWQLSLGDLEVF